MHASSGVSFLSDDGHGGQGVLLGPPSAQGGTGVIVGRLGGAQLGMDLPRSRRQCVAGLREFSTEAGDPQ
jgi:hypothetical protein